MKIGRFLVEGKAVYGLAEGDEVFAAQQADHGRPSQWCGHHEDARCEDPQTEGCLSQARGGSCDPDHRSGNRGAGFVFAE